MMKTTKDLKKLIKVAEKDLDELFVFVNERIYKQECKNHYIQAIFSVAILNNEHEVLDARYNTNDINEELLDIHLEAIRKDVVDCSDWK